eukprot:TRINITY_DN5285_c0_g1_i4.p1 TRINITY_DN5285_c0_g1~~TRINITY_DN5285_c0_g1_i4.p1  ORF type:complete len:524 (-),score=106.47 TRINITY_DN5285_c0_g1_i4:167-1738(-)
MLSDDSRDERASLLRDSEDYVKPLAPFLGTGGFHFDKDDSEGYRPIVSFVFTVNFLVGAGVLGLPYAFAKAGILASALFLFFIMILGCITMSWMVEVQGRLTGIIESRGDLQHVPSWAIKNYKFEASEIVEFFLGKTLKRVYIAALFLFSEGALWVYTVVFSASMMGRLGFPGITDDYDCDLYEDGSDFGSNADKNSDGYKSCQNGYYIYVVIYGCLMCFLALRDLKAQVGVQMSLTGMALMSMMVMIFTTIGAMGNGPYPLDEEMKTNQNTVAADQSIMSSGNLGDFDLVNFGGIAYIFSAAVFSMLAHHGAPGVTRLCEDKTKVRSVFMAAMATTVAFYVTLSVVTAMYFGTEGIKEVVTLNWKDYEDFSGAGKGFSAFISYLVVLFPCLTVSCAFPLYVVTLSNNVAADIPYHIKNSVRPEVFTAILRITISLIPLLGGMFQRDPALLVNFTGIFGFLLMFFFPAMLQYHSKKQVEKAYGKSHVDTPYSWRFSRNVYIYTIAAIATAGFFATVVFTIQDL